MARHTTFRWALAPTAEQETALRRHAGASRFAFNQCLRFVVDALDERQRPQCRADDDRDLARASDVIVPFTGFDLINAFNAWKRSAAAGVSDDGAPGLVWRHEVSAQVFEEAAINCGRALGAWSASRRGQRAGLRVGFPSWKRRGHCRDSFRLRNKVVRGKQSATSAGRN